MDKATGITRPVKGEKEWVELWVGDIIKCRVYITDRAGCYLWIDSAEVFWEKDYGQYSIKAKYHQDGKDGVDIFALREVLRRNVEFITKVPRENGSKKDIILAIVEQLRVRAKNSITITDRFVVCQSDENGQITCTDDDIRTIVDTAVYDAMDDIVDKIGDMGLMPKEEINVAFVKES